MAVAAPSRPASIPRTPPPAMPPPPMVRPQAPAMGRAAPTTAQPPASSTHTSAQHAVGSSVAANGAALRARLEGLDLTAEQTQAVLALSREVIERVVWEVVPVLAETLIREEIQRLTRD